MTYSGTTPLPCFHQFFKVRKMSYAPMTKKESQIMQGETQYGVLVVCAFCGERRELWDSGVIQILGIGLREE